MGFRVLIVDDNKIDARLLKDFLLHSEEPFEDIVITHTKEEYENQMKAEEFDLILSDFRLINFNGIDAIHLRNQHCKDVPIIIVSGTIGEEKAVEVIKEGASDFLIKNNIEDRLVQVAVRAIKESDEKNKRRKAEKLLKESERTFRLLAENSTDMISRVKPNGDYLYVSPASKEVLGYEPEEMVDTSLYDYIHPEDFDEIEKIRTNKGDKEILLFTYRVKRKDGSWQWVETITKEL